jgi:hypothetical protein
MRFGDAGIGRRQGALAAQVGRLADIHLEGAVIVLGCREFPEFSVALEQPERSGHDPDADARIPGLQPLQGRDGHAETFGPRFEGFLAVQAGHREVCAQLSRAAEVAGGSCNSAFGIFGIQIDWYERPNMVNIYLYAFQEADELNVQIQDKYK